MKLLNLNVSIKINNNESIVDFIKQENPDIITLQEVQRHLEDKVLPQYKSEHALISKFAKTYPNKFFGPLWIGEAIRKNGKIHRDFGGLVEQGNEILSKFPLTTASNEFYYKNYEYKQDWTDWEKQDHGRALLLSEFAIQNKKLQILNVHGIWTKDKKGDNRTIKQNEFILKAAKRKDIATIIVGDFNLSPETNSIQILSKEFKNLILEYNIKSTRPDFKDNVEKGNTIVDYIFVNDKIKVNNFQVLKTAITDHLPLSLDFEIN